MLSALAEMVWLPAFRIAVLAKTLPQYNPRRLARALGGFSTRIYLLAVTSYAAPCSWIDYRRRPPPPLEPDDTLRLPTRSPPPPRSMLPACCLPPRSIAPPCCLPPICPWFWRAFACRLDMESPRAVPPYLLAVALFEYGAPPRCWALCCQLLPLPVRFPVRLPVLLIFCLFELFTKLLLLFMLILLLPPYPLLQHQPPPMAAPTIIPTPNETAMPAA